MMRLRHIEVFHAVYSAGSVSAAARALHVSQPSVTKVLQHAEQVLGFPLFERIKGKMVPTADAHALFDDAAAIQSGVHLMQQRARNLRRGRGTTLRLSTLPSLGLGAIPRAVARFLERHREVRFELHTIHTDDIARNLLEGESDIVISYHRPRGAALQSVHVGRGEMVLLYRAGELRDPPARVALDRLAGLPFVSTVDSGPQGQMLLAALEQQDLQLDEVAAARTFFVAAALVEAGVGVTVVDSYTASTAVAQGLESRPLDPPIAFDVYALYPESRPPGALAAAFLEHLVASLAPATNP
ncbi:LysR family transcriptional regulator [Sphingomonas folli]|uniref:LysR family transcriptional regulator n=1 Tax=Sphingomonas folli TaxID=2862497 RepID=UPI0027E3BFB0|nr:LysR family transcriptional regulator [Sphingomonas folli]